MSSLGVTLANTSMNLVLPNIRVNGLVGGVNMTQLLMKKMIMGEQATSAIHRAVQLVADSCKTLREQWTDLL